MSLYRIQGSAEKREGIYYEFDSTEKPLGEGGMGKVYKGRCVNERNGNVREVAVKFLYEGSSQYVVEKSRREAAIRFKHENLIEMLGFIETESKSVTGETQYRYHVVSELLEGVTLEDLFEGRLTDQFDCFVPFAEKMHREYQQDPVHFTVQLAKNILSGLMTMHDAQYIHRDISPSNIMLTSDGKIKLIDFGIAKKMDSLTNHDKNLTSAGQFIGKPEYAAPELVLGSINEQNQTTDIYAVGILMFQCVVGHLPFTGDRADILQKQLHSPLPLNLIKHKGLQRVIKKACEKSRTKRYQSAAEFRVALDSIQSVDPPVKWVKYVAGGILIFGLSFGAYKLLPDVNTVTETHDYSYALKAMYDNNDFSCMDSLASAGDAKACYLMSRLYFKSRSRTSSLIDDTNIATTEYQADSITILKERLNIQPDNYKAHDLLKKAIELDPKHYPALFELACDYWRTDDRSEVIQIRDGERTEQYFRQARKYAQEVDDSLYIYMSDFYLERVKQWNERINK